MVDLTMRLSDARVASRLSVQIVCRHSLLLRIQLYPSPAMALYQHRPVVAHKAKSSARSLEPLVRRGTLIRLDTALLKVSREA